MKKIGLVILIILLTITETKGQEINKNEIKKFSIGLNIGPNFNTLRGASFAERYDGNTNFFGGLSFEYFLNKNLSILLNLNYDLKSVKTEYRTTVGFYPEFEIVDIKDKTQFQYLNIPILLRYSFGFENKFFINEGIFYNQLFDVSNEMINIENGKDLSDLYVNSFFKNKDYGISIGIGMNFRLNNRNNLSIEIRDDLGISNIGNLEFGGISPTNTNTLKLILNWNFKI